MGITKVHVDDLKNQLYFLHSLFLIYTRPFQVSANLFRAQLETNIFEWGFPKASPNICFILKEFANLPEERLAGQLVASDLVVTKISFDMGQGRWS